MLENHRINCFLIGVQKAGTSSFYNWLSQHPQINAPQEMKDTHFFSYKKYLSKGVDWMESFYKSNTSKPILLKGAVNYVYFPDVPKAIKEYNSESKFLLILRDPAKRAFSAYQYLKKLGIEKRSFEQAIKEEQLNNFSSEEARGNFTYIGHGYYFKQIKQWLNFFNMDAFHILIYETDFNTPEVALEKTFNFLGIDHSFKPKLSSVNKTGAVKYKWINNLFFSSPRLIKMLKKLKLDKVIGFSARVNFLNWLRDWNTSGKNKARESLTPEMYAKLSAYYEEDVSNLSLLLNKDFKAMWKY